MNDDAPPPPDALHEVLGFHIRLAHGAVYRHFSETFADLGLTQKQVSVMWLIEAFPQIAQTDLAERLQMDRATTMAIVNRLQSRELLTRGKSQTDKRKQILTLTATGQETLANAKLAIAQHESWLNARFTDEERETLRSLLMRIHQGE